MEQMQTSCVESHETQKQTKVKKRHMVNGQSHALSLNLPMPTVIDLSRFSMPLTRRTVASASSTATNSNSSMKVGNFTSFEESFQMSVSQVAKRQTTPIVSNTKSGPFLSPSIFSKPINKNGINAKADVGRYKSHSNYDLDDSQYYSPHQMSTSMIRRSKEAFSAPSPSQPTPPFDPLSRSKNCGQYLHSSITRKRRAYSMDGPMETSVFAMSSPETIFTNTEDDHCSEDPPRINSSSQYGIHSPLMMGEVCLSNLSIRSPIPSSSSPMSGRTYAFTPVKSSCFRTLSPPSSAFSSKSGGIFRTPTRPPSSSESPRQVPLRVLTHDSSGSNFANSENNNNSSQLQPITPAESTPNELNLPLDVQTYRSPRTSTFLLSPRTRHVPLSSSSLPKNDVSAGGTHNKFDDDMEDNIQLPKFSSMLQYPMNRNDDNAIAVSGSCFSHIAPSDSNNNTFMLHEEESDQIANEMDMLLNGFTATSNNNASAHTVTSKHAILQPDIGSNSTNFKKNKDYFNFESSNSLAFSHDEGSIYSPGNMARGDSYDSLVFLNRNISANSMFFSSPVKQNQPPPSTMKDYLTTSAFLPNKSWDIPPTKNGQIKSSSSTSNGNLQQEACTTLSRKKPSNGMPLTLRNIFRGDTFAQINEESDCPTTSTSTDQPGKDSKGKDNGFFFLKTPSEKDLLQKFSKGPSGNTRPTHKKKRTNSNKNVEDSKHFKGFLFQDNSGQMQGSASFRSLNEVNTQNTFFTRSSDFKSNTSADRDLITPPIHMMEKKGNRAFSPPPLLISDYAKGSRSASIREEI